MLSVLAVLGWGVAAGLAAWRAKWCFRVFMGLYYISITGSCIHSCFDAPRHTLNVGSGLHLTLVLLYAIVFIGGQVALWALHTGWLWPTPQPAVPPNGGSATQLGR